MAEIERAIARITAARADGYGIIVQRRAGSGAGWVEAVALGADPDLTAETVGAVQGMYGDLEPYIQAEWMLESLARGVADLAGSFALAVRAIPDLAPDRVLLAIEGGLVRATAVTSDRLDEADLPGLAKLLREGFTELVAPTIGWIDGQGLRPAKTLWHAAADRLAQSLVWSGKAFDRPDEALELTRLTVGPESPDPRLRIEIRRAEDEYGDEYHLRNTCCLAYRTEGGELCQSCPLQKTHTP
ncbi:MAG: (2Fe-2S)-binding protein [Solirubrobacterales bacterium]|nr:(2Fe-2S)-binding protein [Solirubrobacterales bacterium]